MKTKRPKTRRAFTLVELLTVTGIVAVLAALIIPAISGALEAGKRTRCQANLRQIGLGISNYTAENNGRLPDVYDDGPPGAYWYDAVCAYLNLPEGAWWLDKGGIFHCPAATNDVPNYTMSWSVSEVTIAAVTNTVGRVIVADGPGASGAGINKSAPFGGLDALRHKAGANYLFVDGHVEFLRTVPTNGLTPLD